MMMYRERDTFYAHRRISANACVIYYMISAQWRDIAVAASAERKPLLAADEDIISFLLSYSGKEAYFACAQ